MAENFLSGTVDIPKIGPVKKTVVFGIAGAAVVFIGWKWWQASSGVTDEEVVEGEDPGFEDEGLLPGVDGAIRPGNDYGIDDGEDDNTVDQYGFTGTTNDQWTQYAANQLTQSDRWLYQDIVAALGRYLNSKSLSSTDQEIVQAAIAVAGYPPVGSFQIKPGGDTEVTVAPTGVKVTPKSSTVLTVSWNPVPGAEEYRVYRKGVAQNVGHSLDTVADVGGLKPDTLYTFTVAAMSDSGKTGPRSAEAKGTTKKAELKAPTGLKARTEGHTVVYLTWTPVPGADGYRVYHDGSAHNVGASKDASARISSLQRNRTYKFHVRALAGNTTGPASSRITVKTK